MHFRAARARRLFLEHSGRVVLWRLRSTGNFHRKNNFMPFLRHAGRQFPAVHHVGRNFKTSFPVKEVPLLYTPPVTPRKPCSNREISFREAERPVPSLSSRKEPDVKTGEEYGSLISVFRAVMAASRRKQAA